MLQNKRDTQGLMGLVSKNKRWDIAVLVLCPFVATYYLLPHPLHGIPRDRIGYSEICKGIRRKMKEDIRKHDEKQIIKAIDNSKSLKQAR